MKIFRIFKKKKEVEDLSLLTALLKGIMGKQPRFFKEGVIYVQK